MATAATDLGGAGAAPTHDWLVHYLVRHGLLPRGPARVSNLSRAHRVFLVEVAGSRLICKHGRPADAEGTRPLNRELAVHRLATVLPALGATLPRCRWVDPALQLIVTDFVDPGSPLHPDPSGSLPEPVAAALGHALGHVHRATSSSPIAIAAVLPPEPPWVLDVLKPGAWRPAVTDDVLGHGPVRRALRASFAKLGDDLAPSCLVHGDLKWDNCLLEGEAGVRLVDWESAGWGDPAWDVAGILQEPLVARSAALPAPDWTGGPPGPGSLPEGPGSVDAFVSSYLEAAGLDQPEALVARAAGLAGARLVQTALECASARADDGLVRRLVDQALLVLREPALALSGVPAAS